MRRRRNPTTSRRGSSAVLAMLFLLLISCLAVGFYYQVATSVEVAHNEKRINGAQLAAESGLQFAKYELGQLNVNGSGVAALDAVQAQLTSNVGGTLNLGGLNPSRGNDALGRDSVFVPGRSSGGSGAYNWVDLGAAGGKFRFFISRNDPDMYVTAVGVDATGTATSIQRGVRLKLNQQTIPYVPGAAGLLVKGSVTMSNGARVSGGDVFSGVASGTVPLTISGGARIDQKFSYSTNTKAPSISNGAIVAGGVYANAAASFPQVDVTPFATYVPSATAPAGPKVITATSVLTSTQVFTNIRIKANANTSFGNAQQINGVVYIESPNKITFGGGMKMAGVIVTDNAGSANPTTCQITIANGVQIDTLATLNPANFPASENISALKTLSGAIVLAPNYKVTLAGGSRSYNGALVAGQFDISNGYAGTITGGLFGLNNLPFTMVGGGLVTFTGGNTPIPGLVGGGSRYVLDPSSYEEIQP